MEKTNKMGQMHEGKLLLSMGAPMMLSMLVQALYNIVDSFFVARIPNMGDAAVNALTLAFPVQMLMVALTVGTGVGVGAALSHSLGRGDREEASRTAGNAMFLYFFYYIILLLFGLLGVRAYVAGQTADETVMSLSISYLRIVTCLSFGNMGEKCFEKLLQATGKTTFSMIGQLTGSIINVILDPIFIFGYLGLPAMGVSGAAIATVIGQCCAILVSGTLHFRRNNELIHKRQYLYPQKKIIKKILRVGAPAILMQALTSFMTYGMNLVLAGISDASVTAFGVYYKLQSFIFMPAFGLNNASVPIIGFNHGAGNRERIRNTIRYGLIFVTVIMVFGFILFQCFDSQIVGIFALSETVSDLCVRALQIISFGFVFAGVNIILQGVCQALGNGANSLIISLLRLIVGVIPPAAILAGMQGAEQFVWLVFPFAEIIAFFAAVILTIRLYRKV